MEIMLLSRAPGSVAPNGIYEAARHAQRRMAGDSKEAGHGELRLADGSGALLSIFAAFPVLIDLSCLPVTEKASGRYGNHQDDRSDQRVILGLLKESVNP